jgi:two-component system, OmpR family, KDP operon response regulator KdpE
MTKEATILVVDDEAQIRRALKAILSEKKFIVNLASTGSEGLSAAEAVQPDLIILDLSLPDMDGLEVCRRLREWTRTPIIVLSVRESEKDKVTALDMGADDYLTKPFGIEELLARIRVALRHSASTPGQTSSVIKAGNIQIDLVKNIVLRDGQEIRLTGTELKLLLYLAAHPGRVLTHQSILTNVWDFSESEHVEYLRVYIGALRRKLEINPDQPQILLTEPGIGYRFVASD